MTERDPDTNMALFGHAHLLVTHGIHIIENLNLEELAAAKVHEFGFVGIPLKFRGATGSPIRPLALTGSMRFRPGPRSVHAAGAGAARVAAGSARAHRAIPTSDDLAGVLDCAAKTDISFWSSTPWHAGHAGDWLSRVRNSKR